MTRAQKIRQGPGLARPSARLNTSATREYVRRAPTTVGLFSGSAAENGHPGPVHSSPNGAFDQSRKVAWTGGNATAFQIRSMFGEVEVLASLIELHFIWNSGYIEGEARSGGKIITKRVCNNRPTFAYVLPPGTLVEFRLKEAVEYQQLSIELQPDFVLAAVGLETSASIDVIETWDYSDPLSWQLARVINDECVSHAPQGTLYVETAATLLAIHLFRNLSTFTRLKKICRGGLSPSVLRRTCDYMLSRLGEDISLHEVAACIQLSTGHFSTAFKQSLGLAPYAWLRRQRIERAKRLLRDPNLDLTQIALILGYANSSSFGVAFRRETGLTPTRWRACEAI
jgi:AraC family transcriptional regulator